jgi:hypothetical protein
MRGLMIIQVTLTLGCTYAGQGRLAISLNQKIRDTKTAKPKNFATLLFNQFLENGERLD